jgi:2-methylisocitrate lyase-like PEP mutase family enzyme
MPARLAEQAGFEAVYMPGGGVALDRLGVADVGLLTLNEMAEAAGAIAQSVSIPLIADADTGFGNELNVQRTIREYEKAGAAAIHIEDQTFPKRCGHLAGKDVVPRDEAVSKIRAAVAARRDPDFMIIARCDALAVAGFDEVRERCAAYLAAGADMLFVEGARSLDETVEIPRAIPGPHVFNMSAGGQLSNLDVAEIGRLGYKLMILPNFAGLAAIRSITEVFAEIRRSGSVETIRDRCASFGEFTALGGLDGFLELSRSLGIAADGAQAAH